MSLDIEVCKHGQPGHLECQDCAEEYAAKTSRITKVARNVVAIPSSALDKQEGGDHYKDCKIQPIQFIHANDLDFFQGNIIKYASRHKKKNGAEDLKKVIHYAQLALELQYGVKP